MPFVTMLLSESEQIYKVALQKKIYADTSSELEQALDDLIRHKARHLLLDLTQLELIDSSGLRALIIAVKLLKAEQRGGIAAFGMTPNIQKIFGLISADRLIPCFPGEAEALAHLRGQS